MNLRKKWSNTRPDPSASAAKLAKSKIPIKRLTQFPERDLYEKFLTIKSVKGEGTRRVRVKSILNADALAELFEKVKPLRYEIIFFMEDNSRDIHSTPTYFVRTGHDVQVNQLLDPKFLNIIRITKLIRDHGIPCHQINPPKVKELLDIATKKSAFAYKDVSLKEFVWAMFTPVIQGTADIFGGMADGINSAIESLDHIKISSEGWNYAIGDKSMDLFFFPFYESHAQPVNSDDVKKMLTKLKADVERNFNPTKGSSLKLNFTGGPVSDLASDYFQNDVMVTVYEEFSDLLGELEVAIDRMVEGGVLFVNAFICGFWNSIVSCIQGILFIFYLVFEIASALLKVHARPETYDSFIQMLEDFDFRTFIREITALFRKVWDVFLNLDWLEIASEIKVAQIGYFVGALVEFALEILVGGLVPGLGLAVTIVAKSAKLFGTLLSALIKVFRKVVPKKWIKTPDLSELTFQIFKTKTPEMILAISEAKKLIVLWLENLRLIIKGVSFEDIQKLEKLGLRIGGNPDVYIQGVSFSRRSTQRGVWEILRDGRVVFKRKGTKGEVDDVLEMITKLSDDEIERLRKLSDEDFGRYLDGVLEALTKELKISSASLKVLLKMADEALLLSSKKRPKACAVLEAFGKKMFNFSFKRKLPPGVYPDSLHPLVRKWLDDMWLKYKLGQIKIPEHHGKCAEVVNISDWLKSVDPKLKMSIDEAREMFDGVKSHARQIGDMKGGEKLKHGDYKKACDSCNPLLEYFNITEVK
ncbi:MAG: hypothetical protein GQ574_26305 [Crocinitomix sp.]|nr:hypothetical protein [Crocinitomix sp.]